MNNHQLIDNIMPNDMVRTHSDAVLEDQRTRAIPKQMEYEKKCADFLVNTSVKLPDGSSTFLTRADCQQKKAKPAQDNIRLANEILQGCAKTLAWMVGNRGGCSCHLSPPCSAHSDPISEEEAEEVIEHYEYLLEKRKNDAQTDGWIMWTPKPDSVCPVPANTLVFVKLACDIKQDDYASRASEWRWNKENEEDIIAYRILDEE